MDCLVDTHILIWSFFAPKRLSRQFKEALLDQNNTIYYSPVSLWEIAIKFGVGKLKLGHLAPEVFLDRLDESFFTCLELLNGTLIASYQLPMHHRDPFDRTLVWEALQHDLTLLTADESLRAYQSEGLRLLS
jgi:PIN domain nuclease of toxin-antitoxin system